MQQSWPEKVMIFKGLDPSRMRFGVLLLCKPTRLAEEITEDGGM